MQQLESILARVRVRNRGGDEGEGDPTVAIIIIVTVVALIITIIVGVVIYARRKLTENIERYFGPQGTAFLKTLDPKTQKAFREIFNAVQLADKSLLRGDYNLMTIDSAFLQPYGQIIKENETLSWYRFVVYELEALLAHSHAQHDQARQLLAKAQELRGDGPLLSQTAAKLQHSNQ